MVADYFTSPGTNMPMSAKEMLRRTLWIYVTNITTILKIASCVFIPTQIILGIAGNKLMDRLADIERDWDETQHLHLDRESLMHVLFAVASLEFAGCLIYSVAEIAMTEITKNAHAGLTKTTFPEAMDAVKPSIVRVFALMFLTLIAVYVSVCLLVFPGIYLAVSWWVACPVVVVERKSISDAVSKSWGLASGYRCSLIQLFCAYVLSYYILVFTTNTVLFLMLAPRLVRYVFGYCVPVISFRPFGYILQSVVYFDLRARKESLTKAGLLAEIRSRGVTSRLGANVDDDGNTSGSVIEPSPNGVASNPAWAVQSEPLNDGGASQGIWNGRNSSREQYNHFEIS